MALSRSPQAHRDINLLSYLASHLAAPSLKPRVHTRQRPLDLVSYLAKQPHDPLPTLVGRVPISVRHHHVLVVIGGRFPIPAMPASTRIGVPSALTLLSPAGHLPRAYSWIGDERLATMRAAAVCSLFFHAGSLPASQTAALPLSSLLDEQTPVPTAPLPTNARPGEHRPPQSPLHASSSGSILVSGPGSILASV